MKFYTKRPRVNSFKSFGPMQKSSQPKEMTIQFSPQTPSTKHPFLDHLSRKLKVSYSDPSVRRTSPPKPLDHNFNHSSLECSFGGPLSKLFKYLCRNIHLVTRHNCSSNNAWLKDIAYWWHQKRAKIKLPSNDISSLSISAKLNRNVSLGFQSCSNINSIQNWLLQYEKGRQMS